MPASVRNEFDVKTGERVFIPGHDNAGFYEDLRLRKEWREFSDRYDFRQQTGNEEYSTNEAIVEAVLAGLSRGEYPTTSDVCDALKALLRNGGVTKKYGSLVPRPKPELVTLIAPVAVDKNNKILGSPQLAWQEHARWAATASSQQIAERRRTDASFQKFYESSLRLEMQHEIDGDVRPTNPHIGSQAKPSQAAINVAASKAGLTVPELHAWVEAYNETPSNRVRLLRSAGANPTGYQQYEKAFEAAVAANLI
jgi:hypothetical protein